MPSWGPVGDSRDNTCCTAQRRRSPCMLLLENDDHKPCDGKYTRWLCAVKLESLTLREPQQLPEHQLLLF